MANPNKLTIEDHIDLIVQHRVKRRTAQSLVDRYPIRYQGIFEYAKRDPRKRKEYVPALHDALMKPIAQLAYDR